ncbi:MAG: hypothetical protein KF715_13750 [Candidatus Didemnitutus sp.]|nr:hypothetical protein [Candidatus Didemnitutus sp.]
MLNLAAYRYRHVIAAQGGPLARLSCGEVSVLGSRWFEANAYLSDEFMPARLKKSVWGSADGGGTAPSPLVARFKAISEAMERWAHWATYRSGENARYGFDVDPSSNGMAAFPGLFARQARHGALMEAAERFNLMNWWEGRLIARPVNSPRPDVQAFAIESDTPGVTVVLHRRSERGHHAYGHASADTVEAACWKAAVELERHDAVVGYYVLAGHASHERDAIHPIEQRSLFFASDAGYELFSARACAGLTGTRAKPRMVFDGVVPGPWAQYAHVWRVLFEPPSLRFLSREVEYFLW